MFDSHLAARTSRIRSGLSFSTMRIESRFSLHSSDQCSSSCSVIGRFHPKPMSASTTPSPWIGRLTNIECQPTVSAIASSQIPATVCSRVSVWRLVRIHAKRVSLAIASKPLALRSSSFPRA